MENNDVKFDETDHFKQLKKVSDYLIVYAAILSVFHFSFRYIIGFPINYDSMLPYSLPIFVIVHLTLQKHHLSMTVNSSKFGVILFFLATSVLFTYIALAPIAEYFLS
jgi:hypothetical protein